MISKRIRMTAKEMKTVCQSGEPEISDGGLYHSISDCGYRIAERKIGMARGSNWEFYLSGIRFPQSEIARCLKA